jgi:hypothetical protein
VIEPLEQMGHEGFARRLEANYNLMLDPSKLPTEERWHRIMASLGIDPHSAMIKLTSDVDDESSIASCIAESQKCGPGSRADQFGDVGTP